MLSELFQLWWRDRERGAGRLCSQIKSRCLLAPSVFCLCDVWGVAGWSHVLSTWPEVVLWETLCGVDTAEMSRLWWGRWIFHSNVLMSHHGNFSVSQISVEYSNTITKTPQFKYIESFTSKIWKFPDKKTLIFFIWVSRNKKKKLYTLKPEMYYIKVGQNYIGMFSWCLCINLSLTPKKEEIHQYVNFSFWIPHKYYFIPLWRTRVKELRCPFICRWAGQHGYLLFINPCPAEPGYTLHLQTV